MVTHPDINPFQQGLTSVNRREPKGWSGNTSSRFILGPAPVLILCTFVIHVQLYPVPWKTLCIDSQCSLKNLCLFLFSWEDVYTKEFQTRWEEKLGKSFWELIKSQMVLQHMRYETDDCTLEVSECHCLDMNLKVLSHFVFYRTYFSTMTNIVIKKWV